MEVSILNRNSLNEISLVFLSRFVEEEKQKIFTSFLRLQTVIKVTYQHVNSHASSANSYHQVLATEYVHHKFIFATK